MEKSDDTMYNRMRKAVDKRESDNDKYFKQTSHEQLKRSIKTKMMTEMVGIVERFENYFGESWGHGLQEDECDDEQLEIFEIWRQCRDEIFNYGNSQIRAMEKELDLYEIKTKGYHTTMRAGSPINTNKR